MKNTLVRLLLLLVSAPALIAQQTPYIETFEVRILNLDVVVTDAKGNPVRGLTKEDFVVVEDGSPQPLTNFSVYDAQAGRATANTPASAPDAPATTTVIAPPPRRIIFFIDELGVQKVARQRLYNNVKAFVDAMGEGDVAAIVRPTSRSKVVQEFTGDRAALEKSLKEAIDDSANLAYGPKNELSTLRWQLLQNVDSETQRRVAKHEYADVASRRVAHRLGQLRALTSSLAGLEGKKILVLVTMGLTARPGLEAWDFAERMGSITPASMATPLAAPGEAPQAKDQITSADDPERAQRPIVRDYTNAIKEIGRTAAANGVTIYALEPDVPLDLKTRGAASIPVRKGGGGAGPDQRAELQPSFIVDYLQNSENTLTSLAELTGGRFFRGLSSIDDTFQQVTTDTSHYYSLGYRAAGNEDKSRQVKVSVRNRPELRVRTRSEVIEKSTGQEMSDLVVASLLYPRPVNELGIAVTAGAPQKDRGLFTIPIDVVIPLKNLTFLPSDGGKYVASFDLYYAATGEKRDFGAGGKQQQLIEVTPEQYATINNTNYRYKTGIQVSPGPGRIAIGILDPTTKLTGFRTVEVVAQ